MTRRDLLVRELEDDDSFCHIRRWLKLPLLHSLHGTRLKDRISPDQFGGGNGTGGVDANFHLHLATQVHFLREFWIAWGRAGSHFPRRILRGRSERNENETENDDAQQVDEMRDKTTWSFLRLHQNLRFRGTGSQ